MICSCNIKLKVSEESSIIKLHVSDESNDSLKITSDRVNITTTSGDPYQGPYIVTPLANEQQILNTKFKYMSDDVTVNKVPYYETSNDSGTTVYIASGV